MRQRVHGCNISLYTSNPVSYLRTEQRPASFNNEQRDMSSTIIYIKEVSPYLSSSVLPSSKTKLCLQKYIGGYATITLADMYWLTK
ncbi:hypothetical protein ACS0TY_015592 [Phlomoides rotata]